jgi:hypothetical protein
VTLLGVPVSFSLPVSFCVFDHAFFDPSALLGSSYYRVFAIPDTDNDWCILAMRGKRGKLVGA